MSALGVIGAVAAVVSMFHDGAELVAQIKTKQHRRSRNLTQQDFEQRQLQESLQAGESQIVNRFAADVKELGRIVRIGDAIARDRLVYIATVMQSEIVKSLQLTVANDNAILNFKILHEASIMHRKDSVTALDELKQRILITCPKPRALTGSSEVQDNSVATVQTFRAADIAPAPDGCSPSVVIIPAPTDSKESTSALAMYFASKHNNSQSSTSSERRPVSSAESITFSPALDHLIQGSGNGTEIMKDIDDIIQQYQTLGAGEDDIWTVVDGPLHGGGAKRGVKRDTLEILNGGDQYKRDTMNANRDAMQMLHLGNLPPTPEEAHDTSEYPVLFRNPFAPQRQYLAAPMPQHSRRPTLVNSRFSVWSSICSEDADTPSLYSQESRSSIDSPVDLESTPWPSAASQVPQGSQYQTRLESYTPSRPPPTPPKDNISTSQNNVKPSIAPSATSQNTDAISTIFPPPQPRIANPDVNIPPNPSQTRILIVPDHDPNPGLSSNISKSLVPAINRPSTTSTTSLSSITPTPSTVMQPKAIMSGRPCKTNNYFGFCKGAWSTRESLKRGLTLATRPDGMYNTHQIWQCRHCHFSGEVFEATVAASAGKKPKKEAVVDQKIYTSAEGIRYRWIFLVKSHVKKKSLEATARPFVPPASHTSSSSTTATTTTSSSASISSRVSTHSRSASKSKTDEGGEYCNFGCLICSVEGTVTGIYGNVETLMGHIFLEHGGVEVMSERTRAVAGVVVGRVAGVEEEWDLNIV